MEKTKQQSEPVGEITESDFEKIIAEELKNENRYNAYIRCFRLAQQMVAQEMKHVQKARDEEREGWERLKELAERHLPIEKIVGKDVSKVIVELFDQNMPDKKEKPFAIWLKNNNYFKSRTGEKKIYENKFVEGQFTRKELYGLFKKEIKSKKL